MGLLVCINEDRNVLKLLLFRLVAEKNVLGLPIAVKRESRGLSHEIQPCGIRPSAFEDMHMHGL